MFRSHFRKFASQFRKFSTEPLKNNLNNEYANKIILYGAPTLGFLYSVNNSIEKNEIGEYNIGKYVCNGLLTVSIFTFFGLIIIDLKIAFFSIGLASVSGLLYGAAKLKIENDILEISKMIDDRNRKISEVILEISKK